MYFFNLQRHVANKCPESDRPDVPNPLWVKRVPADVPVVVLIFVMRNRVTLCISVANAIHGRNAADALRNILRERAFGALHDLMTQFFAILKNNSTILMRC